MIRSPYQVGGSLTTDNPTYIERQADRDLYQALKQGEFCYVLNARQMGKSSLMVRTRHRLQQEGFCCTSVDLSVIGSEGITPLQWYKGILTSLCLELDLLAEFNLKSWWKEAAELSFIQRLSQFIDRLLTVHFPEKKLFIFIDEVDSILHLDFSVDDFFALIRYFYNQRAIHPHYQRITFAIFGVATPSDLIQDKTRTPFNVGTAIDLQGFQWDEVQPLAANFPPEVGDAETVLKSILTWTGGQPFLTQKLCDLVIQSGFDSTRSEDEWVEQLVQSKIITHWESQDEPEHLKTIRDRLLSFPERSGRILGIYQNILRYFHDPRSIHAGIESNDSRETLELLLSGLVVKERGYLTLKNPIYAAVFNHEWLQQKLDQIRPYSQSLEAWKSSDYQDDSRLLRGKALKEAQRWAENKSLSNLDYHFLAASQKYEDQEIQKSLEAERVREVEARLLEERKRLFQEKKAAQVQQFFLNKVRQETEDRLSREQEKRVQEQKISQLQRLLLKVASAALVVVSILGLTLLGQYRQAFIIQQQALNSEIQALTASSDAFFASHRNLAALISAIKAKQKLQTLKPDQTQLQQQVQSVLEQAVFNTDQYNALSGHHQGIIALAFSGQEEALKTLISASSDQTLKLWNQQGQLLRTLVQNDTLQTVGFSPDGQYFAVGDQSNRIKFYNQHGILLHGISAQRENVERVALSHHPIRVAAVSGGEILQLWTQQGKLLTTIPSHQGRIHSLALSANGEVLASGGEDGQVKLWNRQGDLLVELSDYQPPRSTAQQTVVFSPDSQIVAVNSENSVLKLYTVQGALLKTLKTNQSGIQSLAFSPDSQTIAIAGVDGTIQLWSRKGYLVKILAGRHPAINTLKFSPDGKTLACGGLDGMIHFWKLNHPWQTTFIAHKDPIQTLKWQTEEAFITLCQHRLIKRWHQGKWLETLSLANQFDSIEPKNRYLLQLIARADPLLAYRKINQTFLSLVMEKMGKPDAVAVDPQGHLIAIYSAARNRVQVWSLEGGLKYSFSPQQRKISRLQWSQEGQWLGLGGNREIELWGRDGQFHRKWASPQAELQTWQLSQNQTVFAVDVIGQILQWNFEGQLLQTTQADLEQVIDLAVSPDGQWVAVIDGDQPNAIQLWDQQGKLRQVLRTQQTRPGHIQFSPKGDSLVSADHRGQVMIWDLNSILGADVLDFACDWVEDYLKTHETLKPDERNLCQFTRS